ILAVFTILWIIGYMLAVAPQPIASGLLAPGGMGAIGYTSGMAAFKYNGSIVVYEKGNVYSLETGEVYDACAGNSTILYSGRSPPRLGILMPAADGGIEHLAYTIPEDAPAPTRTICGSFMSYAVGVDRGHNITLYIHDGDRLRVYRISLEGARLLDAGTWQGYPLLYTTRGLYLVDTENSTLYRMVFAGIPDGARLGGAGQGYVWFDDGAGLVVVGDSGSGIIIRGASGWRVEAYDPDRMLAYIVPVTGWGLIVTSDGDAYRLGFTDAMIPTSSGFTGDGFWLGGFLVARNSSFIIVLKELGEYTMGWGYRTLAWLDRAGQLGVSRVTVDYDLEPAGVLDNGGVAEAPARADVEPAGLGVEAFTVSWDPVSRFFTALTLGIVLSSVLYSLLGEE
ncbi:MAG: hypothetical protein GSR78_02065, partial [Desulfurococcales archaeon]|nr:hypothetical protein [Desulfurococcales archaeon]